jgi:hypothetical protein
MEGMVVREWEWLCTVRVESLAAMYPLISLLAARAKGKPKSKGDQAMHARQSLQSHLWFKLFSPSSCMYACH